MRRMLLGLTERLGNGERLVDGLVRALKESQMGTTRRSRRGGRQPYWFTAKISEVMERCTSLRRAVTRERSRVQGRQRNKERKS